MLDLGRRKPTKSVSLGDAIDRDAQFQFQLIAKLKREYLCWGLPVLSIDTKKKELLGNFRRDGHAWTDGTVATYDHDFPGYGQGKVIPYGVYDVGHNEAMMYLATGSDTGELACDAIRSWWTQMGRARYGGPCRMLILAYSGGSNGCSNRLFKEQLWKVSNWLGVKIRVAHLPSYCSKFNPIDHRLFCHVTRSLQGMVLQSIEQVADAISRTSTTKGLRVVTEIATKVYERGLEASQKLISYPFIQHDEDLPKQNYYTASFRS